MVDEIFDALHSVLAESLFDNFITTDRNSLTIDSHISSFVDQFFYCASGRSSISDIWLDSSQHIHSCFVVFNKNGIADLYQSEESEDFFLFWGNFSNTFDSYDQKVLWSIGNVKLVIAESLSSLIDLFLLMSQILIPEILALLKSVFMTALGFLLLFDSSLLGFFSNSLFSFLFFSQVFRNRSCFDWHKAIFINFLILFNFFNPCRRRAAGKQARPR